MTFILRLSSTVDRWMTFLTIPRNEGVFATMTSRAEAAQARGP